MDIDFSLPEETILLIEFLKPQDFFQLSYGEKQYEIVGKDDVGNFVGIDNRNQVFYLETEPDNTRYIASDLKTFICELMFYKEYVENIEKLDPSDDDFEKYANEFRKHIKELDSNAFADDETCWAVIAEQMEMGML